MSLALQVYHFLPPWARNIAASFRGHYLKLWRYDSRTEEMVEAALAREAWSPEQWRGWQERRLREVLERAATTVPHYRRYWKERRENGDTASWLELENWPVLEKESLRKAPEKFVADDVKIGGLFCDHTSGTTGTPLRIYSSSETLKKWYALSEARWRRWYGVSKDDRWAILGGQLVSPVSARKPPFWVWNSALKQLYMSSYHISADTAPAYLEAIKRYRVRYVLGYSSALYSIARVAVGLKTSCPRLEVAITNAEPLFDHQREVIEEAFSCPVRETYGMAEMAAAAGECGHGRLHRWPDAGIIEIDPVARDGTGCGDLICTGLVNSDMPLVRYRVGDSGALSRDVCECGRTLPLLGSIEGRTDDLFYTSEGRPVGRLDPVFKGGLDIVEAQIVQTSLSRVKVLLVPGEGFGRAGEKELKQNIRQRLGDISVDVEYVERVPRTARGKFRAAVSDLTDKEKAAALSLR